MTLADWLTRSGLSTRAFARLILRDDRTVRRWLSGDTPEPRAVREWRNRIDPATLTAYPDPTED